MTVKSSGASSGIERKQKKIYQAGCVMGVWLEEIQYDPIRSCLDNNLFRYFLENHGKLTFFCSRICKLDKFSNFQPKYSLSPADEGLDEKTATQNSGLDNGLPKVLKWQIQNALLTLLSGVLTPSGRI